MMLWIQGWLQSFSIAQQALIVGVVVFLIGSLGSVFIFIKKDFDQKVFDVMLGFAAGMMIAASFWSLLAPSIEMSRSWVPAALGFLLGSSFMMGLDRFLPHLHLGYNIEEAEGIKTSFQRHILFVLALTLHNIPEGLAIGIAFGAVALEQSSVTMMSALALAIGMAIHHIPERSTITFSLYRDGVSKIKSFWYAQTSAVILPITVLIGALAIVWVQFLLPYALGFAAGAMIFVVVEEVIPESQRNSNSDLATGGTLFGFLTMMILEISLTLS